MQPPHWTRRPLTTRGWVSRGLAVALIVLALGALQGCYAFAAPLATVNLDLAWVMADRRYVFPARMSVRELGHDRYVIEVHYEDRQEARFLIGPEHQRTRITQTIEDLPTWIGSSRGRALPILEYASLDHELPRGKWVRLLDPDTLQLFEGRRSLVTASLKRIEPRRFARARRAGLWLLQPFASVFDLVTLPIQLLVVPSIMEFPP